jgi:hypothetical protein
MKHTKKNIIRSFKHKKSNKSNKLNKSNKSNKKWRMHGGSNLAYTGESSSSSSIRTPELAYTGKGAGTGAASPSMNFFLNSGLKGGTGMQTGCNAGCTQTGGYSPTFSLVGAPWGGAVSQWPGVDGISGGRNYFETTNYKNDPQTYGVVDERFLKGGRRGKRSVKRTNRMNPKVMKGGSIITSLFPQSLVNMGRDLMYTASSPLNALGGTAQPVNPAPFLSQLQGTRDYSELNNYLYKKTI